MAEQKLETLLRIQQDLLCEQHLDFRRGVSPCTTLTSEAMDDNKKCIEYAKATLKILEQVYADAEERLDAQIVQQDELFWRVCP